MNLPPAVQKLWDEAVEAGATVRKSPTDPDTVWLVLNGTHTVIHSSEWCSRHNYKSQTRAVRMWLKRASQHSSDNIFRDPSATELRRGSALRRFREQQ